MRHKSTCASLQEVDLSNSSKGRLGCTCQMPPDLPTRLARKWCAYCYGGTPRVPDPDHHYHEAIIAAVREAEADRAALVAVAKAAQEYLATTELDGPDGLYCGECGEMGLVHTPVCVALKIHRALAHPLVQQAVKEGLA